MTQDGDWRAFSAHLDHALELDDEQQRLWLQTLDEQALKIFWDKRKREAGKLAADSPLKPRAKRRLGKAQFNSYPTRDLQFSWPTALFSWGVIIVTVLAVSATFIFKDAYSPGPLSSPHFRRDLSINPAIARIPNNSTCTTCHAAKTPMNQNCASCHTTSAFNSNVSDIHMKVGLTCVDCHSEHHGRDFTPRTVANVACTGCQFPIHLPSTSIVHPLAKRGGRLRMAGHMPPSRRLSIPDYI